MWLISALSCRALEAPRLQIGAIALSPAVHAVFRPAETWGPRVVQARIDGLFLGDRVVRAGPAPWGIEGNIPELVDALEAPASPADRVLVAVDRRLAYGALADVLGSAGRAGYAGCDLLVDDPAPDPPTPADPGARPSGAVLVVRDGRVSLFDGRETSALAGSDVASQAANAGREMDDGDTLVVVAGAADPAGDALAAADAAIGTHHAVLLAMPSDAASSRAPEPADTREVRFYAGDPVSVLPLDSPRDTAWFLPPRVGTGPAVVPGLPVVEGGLGVAAVSDVVAGAIQRLSYCYAQALALDPSLRGELILRFSVESGGAVSGAEVASAPGDDARLRSCMASKISGIRFPSSPSRTDVTLPLDLRPGP